MKFLKKIMVTVHQEERSVAGRVFIAELIKEMGAELVILNIINSAEVIAMQKISKKFDIISVSHFMEDEKQERIKKTEDFVNDLGLPLESSKIIVRQGDTPYKEILKVVEEENIDLLVLGTMGRSKFSELFLNPTFDEVVRRCPIPVMSIPIRLIDEKWKDRI